MTRPRLSLESEPSFGYGGPGSAHERPLDSKHLRHGGIQMIRFRTSLLTVLVVAIVAAAILGCAKRENEIVIGEYGSLTGSTATFGISTKNGIELYVDNVNAGGGVG